MGKMSHLAKMSHLTTLRHKSLCAVNCPAVSHFLIWGADYLCANNSGGTVSMFLCMFLFSLILYTENKCLILPPLLLSAWTTGMHHCP